MFTLTEASALEQEGIEIIEFSKSDTQTTITFQTVEKKQISIVCMKKTTGAFSLHTRLAFEFKENERQFFLHHVKSFIENLPSYRLHAVTTQDFVTFGKSIEEMFTQPVIRGWS